MNEFENKNINPENEQAETTQKILDAIDELGLNALPYVTPSLFNKGAEAMYMQTPEQYRVVIEKAGPDFVPEEGRFFQSLRILVHPSVSKDANFKQIDYNFNEKGDGQFRKRMIGTRERGMEDVVAPHTHGDVAVAGMHTHINAMNMLKNMQLEEDMGVNNQPASLDELHEIEEILQTSVLLDPGNDYRPVTL
jgi:hypothetical protein